MCVCVCARARARRARVFVGKYPLLPMLRVPVFKAAATHTHTTQYNPTQTQHNTIQHTNAQKQNQKTHKCTQASEGAGRMACSQAGMQVGRQAGRQAQAGRQTNRTCPSIALSQPGRPPNMCAAGKRRRWQKPVAPPLAQCRSECRSTWGGGRRRRAGASQARHDADWRYSSPRVPRTR